jgi:hypothetical protein
MLSLEIKVLSLEESINRKINNEHTYAFSIYLVEKFNIDELYAKIVN